MSQDLPPDFPEDFAAMMSAMRSWTSLTVTLEDVEADNAALVEDLKRFNGRTTIPLLASLLTLPGHQSQCQRLELLVALALLHCDGAETPTRRDLADWYHRIGQSQSVSGEDPAEDVFVTLVEDDDDDYRLLEGLWEAAGFYTQRVLDVVASMPDNEHYQSIRRSVRAILRLADTVCTRASLKRYQLGSDEKHETLHLDEAIDLDSLAARVTIDQATLDQLDISFDELQPFVVRPAEVLELKAQQPGASTLELRPLIWVEDGIIVALPTALSVALRTFIIDFIKEAGMEDAFDKAMANAYSYVIHDTPLLGGHSRAAMRWTEVDDDHLAQISLDLGAGHILVMLFVLPSIRHHGSDGFKGMYSDEGELAQAIDGTSEQARRRYESRPDFQRGLIVNVVCGWGLGYSHVGAPLDDSRWQTESMSAADLMRLSYLVDMSPDVFWRLQDAVAIAEDAGVTLLNLNGVLNLYGWVEHNDGHMVPHAEVPTGRITPENGLILQIPLNLLRDVRAKADDSYDRHRARDHRGVSHRVHRATADEFFPSAGSVRMYISLDELARQRLTGVYEGDPRLWVTIAAPNMEDRSVHYHLWQMVCTWLPRISVALSNRDLHESGLASAIKVYVTFQDSSDSRDLMDTSISGSLDDMCEVIPHSEDNAVEAVFMPGFLAGFKDPSNIAERAVVRTLTRAILTLTGAAQPIEESREIEQAAVRNDQERSFHVFQGHNFTDYLASTLTDPLIAIDRMDDAAIRIGLGWRALDNDASGELQGKATCGTFLQKLVDHLLDDIKAELSKLDRTATVVRLTRNCEVANLGERKWRNTSAAVLALHSDFPDLRRTIVEQLSKYSGARTTSRVLAELALCICPLEGGREPSDLVLSKLLARISNVIRIGGYADAIHFNALPAELQVSPLGDVLIRDSLGELVVNPMLARAMNEGFDFYASRSARYYAEPEIAAESKGAFEPVFWAAWLTEMGFDIDQGRMLTDAIDAEGVRRKEAVFLLKRSELEAIGVGAGVAQASAQAFINQFTLATRPQWDKVPREFSLRDIYPWRYGRRLSAITRPLLQLDRADDPTIVVAPGILRQGFVYVVDGAHKGRLAQTFFRTHEMRNVWLGRAGEGHTFNHELAEALRDAGWNVRENLGFPELLRRSVDRDSGDIDVLAWRHDRNDVLIVECKDLSFARNYSEVAALLSEYQGEEVDGKPDKLKKHLKRVELANANLANIARFTGIESPKLVSWLVFSGVTPMHYAKIEALNGTHVGLTEDIVAYGGPVSNEYCRRT